MYKHNVLTLAECREAVANGNIKYTDEQLIQMRDWLTNMTTIALEYLEKNGVDYLDELIARTEKEEKTNHKCSKTTLACRMVFRNPVKKVAGKKPTAVVQSPKKILNKQICESCNCL